MMEAKGLLLTCLILQALVIIIQGQSVDLTVKRTPGKKTCASLRCSAKAPTNGSIRALIKLTIYDITDANARNRIAYKVRDEDLFINPTKISDVTGTDYWSRYHANLTLNLQNEIDCLYGKFQCELKYLIALSTSEYISKDLTDVDPKDGCATLKQQNGKWRNKEILLRMTCFKGNVHTSTREKFLLWGSVEALCDTVTDGGGWVIIQRRTNSDVIFERNWQDYKTGFGNITTNFWYGLDNIHCLTSQGYTELRVDLEYQGETYFAKYSTFRVGDELSKYNLSVSGFDGNAGNCLSYHNGMKFSTYDQDNDVSRVSNCASTYNGGWWYQSCLISNLNGIWANNDYSGLLWRGVSSSKSASFSEMKVRLV